MVTGISQMRDCLERLDQLTKSCGEDPYFSDSNFEEVAEVVYDIEQIETGAFDYIASAVEQSRALLREFHDRSAGRSSKSS